MSPSHIPASISIKFWKLRQHNSSLRPNVLVLVALRELLQNQTYAAVGSYRFEKMQGFGAGSRIGILD
jgi:hypothetical protein